MDRASSLIFPGSRTLAGWWRQLQPYQPCTFHVGYGYVHRVEAPVQAEHHQPVDALAQLVLKAVTLRQSDDGIGERLGIPASILRQIFQDMEKAGLVKLVEPAGWRTTERGRLALGSGRYPIRVQVRRVFPFLENLNTLGERRNPPRFVPVAECSAVSWKVEDPLGFEPSLLEACIAQPADWKERWGFPLDVESCEQDSFASAWQQVIVDRPERFLMVLIQAGAPAASEWIAFAAKADGWILYDQAPIFRLPLLPELLEWTDVPPASVWQDAWRSWCRQRNLPATEAESCTLSHHPPRLEIQAPERFLQRLRAAKSDLLRGEAWVLVGDGYLRAAALLSVASA